MTHEDWWKAIPAVASMARLILDLFRKKDAEVNKDSGKGEDKRWDFRRISWAVGALAVLLAGTVALWTSRPRTVAPQLLGSAKQAAAPAPARRGLLLDALRLMEEAVANEEYRRPARALEKYQQSFALFASEPRGKACIHTAVEQRYKRRAKDSNDVTEGIEKFHNVFTPDTQECLRETTERTFE